MAEVYARFLCIPRRIGLLGFVVRAQSAIYKESLDLMDTETYLRQVKSTSLFLYHILIFPMY